MPAKDLIAIRKSRAEENFLLAEKSLERLEKTSGDRENIWNITGYDAILHKVNECIITAKKRILLEIWSEDFAMIEGSLREASNRGVNISIIVFNTLVVYRSFNHTLHKVKSPAET